MSRNAVIGLLAFSFMASTAYATIEEWTSVSSGFTIYQYEKQILITAPGTYKFQSYDGDTPDDIRWIRVQSGVSGTVEVHVYQDPNDGDGVGAADLKECNLLNAGTGELASESDVICDNITGEIEIGGDLDGHNIVVSDAIDEDITIDGLLTGNITADSMENLTITGTNAQTGDHTGSLTINGQYTEEITIGTDGGREAAMQGRGGPPIACDGWGRDFPGKRVGLTE